MLGKSLCGALAAVLAVATLATAHPGEKVDLNDALREAHNRHLVADINSDALSQCDNPAEIQARRDRAMARRLATFRRLRAERGISNEPYIHRRDNSQFAKWAKASHDKTGQLKIATGTPHKDVFGANSTCIMTPDNIIGPYFVLGEQVRSNVVEGHRGVPVHLEAQFVDVTACRPAAGLLIDLWQCNATGVYSGVSAAGQGGLRSTFLRGAQATDADGVAAFDTIFPGHYQGRASHQHLAAHTGARLLPNNTYAGGTVSHIAQLFYDQALIAAVEKLAPYSANRVPLTTNAADMYTGYAATAAYDPFPEYVLLDANDLSKGVFMWVEIGLNPAANWNDYAPNAAFLGPDGGTNNPKYNLLKAITPPPTHG